ncbi:hypothetical protein PVAG01_02079 [Phlyctema vagabunda]|uniref:BTB domain-containing protein n=1 Tax=Phlyctema vagabunda TaxID=108571 RepID=A0ABR4PQ22_9HELO
MTMISSAASGGSGSSSPAPVTIGRPMETTIRDIRKYHLRGDKPDMNINFCNAVEFHVHSSIVRILPGAFRELTSDQLASICPVKFFRSTDGLWTLTPSKNKQIRRLEIDLHVDDPRFEARTSTFGGTALQQRATGGTEREQEIRCFENLLNAFYARPYTIGTAEELQKTTVLAGLCSALPVLNATILSAVCATDGLVSKLSYDDVAVRCLEPATVIRNAVFFRDVLIHALNPWDVNNVLETRVKNPKLKSTISHAKLRVCEKIATFYWQFSVACYKDQTGTLKKTQKDISLFPRDLAYPHFFRWLYDNSESSILTRILCPLLENNLTFAHSSVKDDHYTIRSFFCVDIGDEYLPWDTTEREC